MPPPGTPRPQRFFSLLFSSQLFIYAVLVLLVHHRRFERLLSERRLLDVRTGADNPLRQVKRDRLPPPDELTGLSYPWF